MVLPNSLWSETLNKILSDEKSYVKENSIVYTANIAGKGSLNLQKGK